MRVIFFSYLFLFTPLLACPQQQEIYQTSQPPEVYKNVVKQFYIVLYKKSATISEFSAIYAGARIDDDISMYLKDSLKLTPSDIVPFKLRVERGKNINESTTSSYIFKKVKAHFSDLTDELSLSELMHLIEKAKAYNEGLQFSDYLELSLSERKKIYFELNTDTPTQIIYVWLSNGCSLYSIINNELYPHKLLLVGTINDKDGYVNIRDKPSKDAKVIDKITDKEYFYYVPNSDSDWLEVSRKDDMKSIIGYVHKSRILKYSEMPYEIRKVVIKDRRND